ncbi:MAG: Urease accessory protein UreE [Azospirillum sp.]|nr:Urease accessory protein UreE [Azospirillum sp.]
MRRALAVEKAWDRTRAAGTVTLAHDRRHLRRQVLRDDSGVEFLLDLVHAAHLRDGDGLALDDGRILAVRAAEEDVLDIAGRDAAHTAKLAWHLGNRHLAVQVLDDGRLRIAADHVIAEMLKGLGARVGAAHAPFDPEAGAYHAH